MIKRLIKSTSERIHFSIISNEEFGGAAEVDYHSKESLLIFIF